MKIVVVGAGPAGMAAARTAADAGAEVTMVDAEPEAGGQFLRGRAKFAHHGVTHLRNVEAWMVEDSSLHLRSTEAGSLEGSARRSASPRLLHFDALIIATGAYDRPLPFPGWDGPGVITAGAAQALAKQGVRLADRVIVAGTGPFLLPVATALQELGATLVGVYEANSPLAWAREAKAVLANRHKIAELASYRKVLPHLETRTAVIAKHGSRVTVAKLDRRWRTVSHRTEQADLVCIGYGFLPRTDLVPNAKRTNDFLDVDERQQTSLPGVYAAGEVTGIGGADLAEAEGVIAGAAAAQQEPPAAAVEAVRRGRLFAQALARAHAIQHGWKTWLHPGTTVCRCEKVSLDDLTDATTMRELKLTSRVAMGRCQGRICARNAAELTGVGFDGQRRVIAVPIPLGELADLPEENS
jgi:NADPH-dependent 2,4-dienoyl-CoA reductase/sulfur reductase-like enzyme